MTISFAAVGEIVLDAYSDGPAQLGGISANVARVAAHWGARTTLFAPVGDDDRGVRVRAMAERAALASAGRLELRLRTLAGETAEQSLHVGSGGERVFTGFRAGVTTAYALEEGELGALSSFDVVHVPMAPESKRVCDQILASGHPRIAVDVSIDSVASDLAAWLEPALARVAFAFVGGRQADVPALRALSEKTHATIVLTAGAAGAFAFERGRTFAQPTLAREVVDTTGCGDALQAAFLVSSAAGRRTTAALEEGARAAARVAAKRGGGLD